MYKIPRFKLMALIAVFSFGCSTSDKYVGRSYDVPAYFKTCGADRLPKCQQRRGDFSFRYSISTTGPDTYRLVGQAKWHGSVVYNTAQTLAFDFFLMKDDGVVELVRAWANDDLDRPIDFGKQFSTTNDFDYAVVGTYSGTISESRF